MEPMTKVYLLDEEHQKFFGEGPYRLLTAVEETGSLRAAAASMGMAYTKALKLIHHAEKVMDIDLTIKSTGGRAGGGSLLTPEGKELMAKYEIYRNRCEEANRRIYQEIFGTDR